MFIQSAYRKFSIIHFTDVWAVLHPKLHGPRRFCIVSHLSEPLMNPHDIPNHLHSPFHKLPTPPIHFFLFKHLWIFIQSLKFVIGVVNNISIDLRSLRGKNQKLFPHEIEFYGRHNNNNNNNIKCIVFDWVHYCYVFALSQVKNFLG